MKKYLISMILGLTAVSSFAQVTNNIFADRAELIKKLGTSQSISMGWYTGAISNNSNDIREINDNYLGLSNYLSVKMNNLIVLEVIKSDKIAAEEALKGNFDIVYTSALYASQLSNLGWIPLVERSENFTPTIIALKNNKKFNDIKDLDKVKVIGSGASFTFTTYSLSSDKLLDLSKLNQTDNFNSKKLAQESLVAMLNNQQVDGIIVRDVLADKLLKESDKYKVIYKAQTSPGHMILINPKIEASKIEQIKNTFLSLNNLDKNSIVIKGIDGHKMGMEIFKPVVADDLKISNTVFKKTNQMPLILPKQDVKK